MILWKNLVVRTHVEEASGAKFEQFVEIWRMSDNQLVAKARSLYAALDAHIGRPRRVEEALRRRFHATEL